MRTTGPYMMLGIEAEPGPRNIPSLIGEAMWTLLGDNTWAAPKHGVTHLVRGPRRRRANEEESRSASSQVP